jgi:hypothetical protein
MLSRIVRIRPQGRLKATHHRSYGAGSHSTHNDTTQDSTQQMQVLMTADSGQATFLDRKNYIVRMKMVYLVYKECHEHLEANQQRCTVEQAAAKDQLSGGYKVDAHQMCTIFDVKSELHIKGELSLLNLVVNAAKNTNSALLLHMIQDLITHPASNAPEQEANLTKFIKLIRDLFPERLAVESKAQKVPDGVIKQLIEDKIDSSLIKLWSDNVKNIKMPLAHTQWCSVSNGLRSGEVSDYYQLLQIEEHPTLGRKPSIIVLKVPKEFELKIQVAFSQALANTDKGKGGIYQVFFNPVDLLFLLSVGT